MGIAAFKRLPNYFYEGCTTMPRPFSPAGWTLGFFGKEFNKLKFAGGEKGLSAEPVRALSRAGRAESRSLYVWLAPLTSTMTAPS